MQCEREPLIFSAGDTLQFTKYFRDYLPSAGWSLFYEVRGGAAGDAEVRFDATADSTNTFFEIDVTSAVTALWLAGDFVLVGFVVNSADANARHQVYYGGFQIQANLGDGANDADVTTFCQRMLQKVEAQLEQLASHVLDDTTVQQTELRRVKRDKLMQQRRELREERRNELAILAVRNGKPSGRKIIPINRIVDGQPGIGDLYYPAIPQ